MRERESWDIKGNERERVEILKGMTTCIFRFLTFVFSTCSQAHISSYLAKKTFSQW